MARLGLDKIDKKILQRLQENGRMSNVELADCVGISAPPCLRRVRILKDRGYIKGYHALIDPIKMGYNLQVFAFVTLKDRSEGSLAEFEDYLLNIPMVREVHRLEVDRRLGNKNIDFFLRVVSRNQKAYQAFVKEYLGTAQNVASVSSSPSIKSLKNLPGIPIE